jgi:uncharacterized protein
MSEHPNVARLREGYEAFGKGDLPALTELWAPDIRWHEPGTGPISGTYEGPDAVFEMFGRLMELTEGSFRAEPLLICADDDHGVVLVRVTAHRGGRSMESLSTHVMRFRDGVSTEFWDAPTDQPSLEAFLS